MAPRPSMFVLSLVFALLSSVHAQYFVVTQPSSSTSWANGSPYPFTWSKGLRDGIDSFDVELTRLSQDGLILVARNVPATFPALNILLQDVPAADDYFVICLNYTASLIYSVSDKFTVTNSSAIQNPIPHTKVPTVTISGPPSPLQTFAITLGPATSHGHSLGFGRRSPLSSGSFGYGGILVLCAMFLGGATMLA